MEIPSERLVNQALDMIKRNSESRGKYLSKYPPDKFVQYVKNKFPMYSDKITSILESPKNITAAILTTMHTEYRSQNENDMEWLNSLISTIMASIKTALLFIPKMAAVIYNALKNDPNVYLGALIVSMIVAGVIGAAVMLSIGLWINIIDVEHKENFNWFDTLFKRGHDLKNPDEEEGNTIKPPPPQSINIEKMFTKFVKISESTQNLTEALELVGLFLFVVFMKAAIASTFIKELSEKFVILAALFAPMTIILSILTTMILLGSGAASSLPA
jgi:hypothetical protein